MVYGLRVLQLPQETIQEQNQRAHLPWRVYHIENQQEVLQGDLHLRHRPQGKHPKYHQKQSFKHFG